jgi:hypothetical protein
MSYSANIVCKFTDLEVLLASVQVTVTEMVFILVAGEPAVMVVDRANVMPPMITVSFGKFAATALV